MLGGMRVIVLQALAQSCVYAQKLNCSYIAAALLCPLYFIYLSSIFYYRIGTSIYLPNVLASTGYGQVEPKQAEMHARI